MPEHLEIRECVTLDELADCVQLQRDVFNLPEVELSPVRHLIVTKNAGGFALGAFDSGRLAGFVLSVPAFMRGERAYYSHMTGVRAEYQSHGVGAALKWAQRRRALDEGVRYIKWTFEPVKARNAHFNLNKLGAVVREYQVNFYGKDYTTTAQVAKRFGLASDRLIAEWHLDSPKVECLAAGEKWVEDDDVAAEIAIMSDWMGIVESDVKRALSEQLRIRREFQTAFELGLFARSFDRAGKDPKYLLYHQ